MKGIYPEVQKMKSIEDFKNRLKISRLKINHTTEYKDSPDKPIHKLELFTGNYMVAIITTNAEDSDSRTTFFIDTVDSQLRKFIWTAWKQTETYDVEVSDLEDFA